MLLNEDYSSSFSSGRSQLAIVVYWGFVTVWKDGETTPCFWIHEDDWGEYLDEYGNLPPIGGNPFLTTDEGINETDWQVISPIIDKYTNEGKLAHK